MKRGTFDKLLALVKRRANPIRVVVGYFVFCVAWIWLSGAVLCACAGEATGEQMLVLVQIRAVLFFIVTSVILFEVLRRHGDQLERQHQQVLDSNLEVIHRLALAAEYRDDTTGNHNYRIGRYSQIVARHLGLPESECDLMFEAAMLHDVGKIAIPDAVLNKPGALTKEERLTMEQHVRVGGDILSGAKHPQLRVAHTIALSHHERWDGTGYPNGLQGTEIPLEGRIVAVVDVFDALTTERPYKKAWDLESAVRELLARRGTHFDPNVVAAFLAGLPEILEVKDAEVRPAWASLRSELRPVPVLSMQDYHCKTCSTMQCAQCFYRQKSGRNLREIPIASQPLAGSPTVQS